jgi:hypothetical protein
MVGGRGSEENTEFEIMANMKKKWKESGRKPFFLESLMVATV